MGLFFQDSAQQKDPILSWPVAVAILSLSSIDTMTCLLSPCWSVGPKQGPPMMWQETV